MIPILETKRLILRPITMDDWPAYREFMGSRRSVYMGGPFTQDVAWGYFTSDHAQWDLLGCGALMLEARATGSCLGQVCVNAGPLFPEYELGWLLYAEFEGQGYAFEAAQAFYVWANQQAKLPSLVSYIQADNQSSIDLAKRLGARLDTTVPSLRDSDLVYRHW